ncbi:hypothetical protein ACWENA_37215 [Streptomyces sp. NPDC004779]
MSVVRVRFAAVVALGADHLLTPLLAAPLLPALDAAGPAGAAAVVIGLLATQTGRLPPLTSLLTVPGPALPATAAPGGGRHAPPETARTRNTHRGPSSAGAPAPSTGSHAPGPPASGPLSPAGDGKARTAPRPPAGHGPARTAAARPGSRRRACGARTAVA